MYYTLCSLYPHSNVKAKWNIWYTKYCSCQILINIYSDSSCCQFYLFILQSYVLLLHNHNNITTVLPSVPCLISSDCQRLPGSTRHWLREANVLFARRNFQIVLSWSKEGVWLGGGWAVGGGETVWNCIHKYLRCHYSINTQLHHCWLLWTISESKLSDLPCLLWSTSSVYKFIPLQWHR